MSNINSRLSTATLNRLKSAPVPATRNAAGNGKLRLTMRLFRSGLLVVLNLARVRDTLTLVQLLLNASGAALFPAVICLEALVTGARGSSLWVEASVLVERHHVWSVRCAKDVATVTAVVTTCENAK